MDGTSCTYTWPEPPDDLSKREAGGKKSPIMMIRPQGISKAARHRPQERRHRIGPSRRAQRSVAAAVAAIEAETGGEAVGAAPEVPGGGSPEICGIPGRLRRNIRCRRRRRRLRRRKGKVNDSEMKRLSLLCLVVFTCTTSATVVALSLI